MDEIMMFAALRPEPPAGQDAMREAARRRVAAVAGGGSAARPRFPVVTGGLIAAASATAVVALVLTSGQGAAPAHRVPAGHAGTVVTAAWTVHEDADGTVTVSFLQFVTGLDRLQRVLRADGINAFVRPYLLPMKNAPGGYVLCEYSHGNDASQAVQRAAVSDSPTTGGFVIHPAAMPEGSALLVTAGEVHQGNTATGGFGRPVVLNNDSVPACTPGQVR